MGILRTIGKFVISRLVPVLGTVERVTSGLRRAGVSYLAKTMTEDIRIGVEGAAKAKEIAKISRFENVPGSLLVESAMPEKYNYRIFGEMTYKDAKGKYHTKFTSYYSNYNMDELEHEAEFFNMFKDDELYEKREIVRFSRKLVWHHKGFAY